MFAAIRNNQIKFDQYMNQDDEFNYMAAEIGFRKNRKRPLIFESGSNEWIAKMCIRKKIVETENYCAKFKEKNCYIFLHQ